MSWTNWIGQRFGLFGEHSRRIWATFIGSAAGEPVTPDRALGVTAFWRGVRLSSETVATLPKKIYEVDAVTGESAEVKGQNQYDYIARVSPNDYQTDIEFWEGLFASMLVFGDGLALKERVGNRLVGLRPLEPTRSYPYRNSQKQLRYKGFDFQNRPYNDLAPEEVFHLKGFSFGGDCGLSAIQYGAGALGVAIASLRVAENTFQNGLSSSGFLETAQTLNEPDRKRLEEIMTRYQGDKKPGKMMILEGGMKYNKLSMSAVDAELLATMGFSIEEVARLLGLPPVLLGHASDGQTMWGTGVESIVQSWYNLGLRAHLTRTEHAFQKRVIEPAQSNRFYLKFSVDGLLRGDSQTRALIAASLAQNGLRNRDELRALDEFPVVPGGGGKKFTAQVNLTTLEKIGEGPDAGTKGGVPPAGSGGQVDQAIKNLVSEIVDQTRIEDALRADRERNRSRAA